jgi:apolipoprotein N-acyltransferase
VKVLWTNSFVRSRYPLAILAGIVLALAFPGPSIAGLAWIAPGLILASALGKAGAQRFRIGYVAGFAFYLVSLHWLLFIPYRWHDIPLGPAAGWLALSGYMALFTATWAWLIAPGPRPQASGIDPGLRDGSSESAVDVPQTGTDLWSRVQALRLLLPPTWARRTLWALSGAAAWAALEMLSARLLGGFPWNLLGTSQFRMLPIIQMAAFTGVFGVSFLLVWFSLSLVSASLVVLKQPAQKSMWIAEVILPMLAVAFLFNYGARQIRHAPPAARSLNVTLVQPSIPQTLIWDETKNQERFQELLRLSEQALTNRTDLLLWPESALPGMLRYDTNVFSAVTNLAIRHKTWIILVSDDAELRPNAAKNEPPDFYNASFLVAPNGRLADRYIKRNLVIFGEYVPLRNWLPFLKYFTPIEGGFTPGTNAVQFALGDLGVQTSVLICFEDVFPHVARLGVEPETDFLINLTNDGWFGEDAAQWQQAAGALFRAVENAVPLIRCSNNGLTCWVDSHGSMRNILRDQAGTIYGPGFMTVEIPLGPPDQKHSVTFYNRYGDLFGWICVAVTILLLIPKITNRWTSRPQPVQP